MGATGTKIDRSGIVGEQTLGTVRQLLIELGGARGLGELAARGPAAHLERELGLGSLERVELMLRLGDACGVRLPDRVVAEADTVQDLIDAILREEAGGNTSGAGSRDSGPRNAGMAAAVAPPFSPAIFARISSSKSAAETLTEIFRLRGRGEPARAHIHLYEENDQLRTITFGELYDAPRRSRPNCGGAASSRARPWPIMLPTCAEFFWTFAGILLAGGIPVPIYPPFRADRIAEYAERQSNILRNAEARFLVTWRQAEGLARPPEAASSDPARSVERAKPGKRHNGQRAGDESKPLGAVASGGKSCASRARRRHCVSAIHLRLDGRSERACTLTHANLLANIQSIVSGIEVQPDDVAVSWPPFITIWD